MAKTDLTLRTFLWRAARLFPETEIVSHAPDGVTRYTYADYADRVARLANALDAAGIEPGDAVGTFCWNHHRHFETYFAVPDVGAKLHTVNAQLPDADVASMVADAEDRLLFVDPGELAQIERVAADGGLETVEQFVVMGESVPDTDLDPVTDYESFVAGHSTDYEEPPLDEDQPAVMCYTSGTTGEPKGVEYTHRMLWTQIMAVLSPSGWGIAEGSVVLQTVPMYHIVGWGWPYVATAVGAEQVFPGPSPDAAEVARLIEAEGVTFTGGVPTIFLDLLEYLADHDADLSSLERIFNGGATPPESLIRRFEDEHGVEYMTGSGMTEVTSFATSATLKSMLPDDPETRYAKRQTVGLALPGMEFTVRDEGGEPVPWDGESVGELHYRGPWVTDEYYRRPAATAETIVDLPVRTPEGEEPARSVQLDAAGDGDGDAAGDGDPLTKRWLKTGDLVTVDADGYIDIVDRTDDMIKSGGEWISSVDLENAIMDHDDVAEAAVVGVPDDRWQERPVAFVVVSDAADPDRVVAALPDLIQAEYPRWWVPDAFEVVAEIPRTGTGKFDKQAVRERFDVDRESPRSGPDEAP